MYIYKGIKIINNYDIEHKCNTLSGSSGGPIFNLTSNKVIGIHKGAINKNNNVKFNIGTLLKFPLEDLKNKNKKKDYQFSNFYSANNNSIFQINISNNFYNNITSLRQINFVPKIGLVNLGQTSYMNSVIQCLSNLKNFTN